MDAGDEEIDDDRGAELLRLGAAVTEETTPQAMRQHLINSGRLQG